MKIIFVGNFNVDFTSETHHANTLQSMGHKVHRLQEGTVTTAEILHAGLQSDLVVWVHTHGWNTAGSISDMSQRLREAGVPIIAYHLDLWMGIGREKDLEDEYYKGLHHFFTVDKRMADHLNDHTNTVGHFIPAAVYDKEVYIHNDYDPNNFDRDIVFVGSRNYHPEWPYRPQLIDWLKENYGDRFTHVGPDGTGVIRGDALNRIYAKSKIAIGDTLNLNFNYPFYSSDRLWESIGRGAFTIYPKIEGLDEYYEHGKEVVYYKHGNFRNLREYIEYYLVNDDEREKIRLEGQYRTKTSGTYINRWHEILETLERMKGKTLVSGITI